MKVITLTQPYATLVAIGAKWIETRSWSTSHRGPLAIHAAQGLGPVDGLEGLRNLCLREPFKTVLRLAGIDLDLVDVDVLPRGAIIAVTELFTIVPTTKLVHQGFWTISPQTWDLTDQERAFGDYSAGRFGWLLSNVRPLPEPIPCRGYQGLWNYEGVL